MRVVVFTQDPELTQSPWWSTVLMAPTVSEVLVCRALRDRSPHTVLTRLRRNIAKHGLIFIPYRAGVLLRTLLRGARRTLPSLPPEGRTTPVEVLESPDIHAPDVIERVRDWRPELGISIGAPILRPQLFRIPTRGTINMHLGAVPDFRGAPPGFWELMFGADEVGATVHWIDEGLDTGRVIASSRAPIYPSDVLERVEARAAELGRLLLARVLEQLATTQVAGEPQPQGGRTNRLPTVRERFRLWRRLRVRALRRALTPRHAAKVAAYCLARLYRPLRDVVRTAAVRHPVRVFTFHRVTHLCRDSMTVTPEVFAAQVRGILDSHDVVSVSDALEALERGARLRRPLAVLTFDDGYRSVFDHAFPIMRELGVPGCCFASTALVGTDRRFEHDATNPVRPYLEVMGWEQLQMLVRHGWVIGGHTANHARLSECPPDRLAVELGDPVRALRGALGATEIPMAYPYGQQEDVTPAVLESLPSYGYRACFSNFGGENFVPADPLRLVRIELGGDHETLFWKLRVHGIDLAVGRRWWNLLRRDGTRERSPALGGAAQS